MPVDKYERFHVEQMIIAEIKSQKDMIDALQYDIKQCEQYIEKLEDNLEIVKEYKVKDG